MIDAARDMINVLLAAGETVAAEVERQPDIWEKNKVARKACGYLEAANALLGRFYELHHEMIELPAFVRLRKLQRTYGTY
jgi:hypothetical protein